MQVQLVLPHQSAPRPGLSGQGPSAPRTGPVHQLSMCNVHICRPAVILTKPVALPATQEIMMKMLEE